MPENCPSERSRRDEAALADTESPAPPRAAAVTSHDCRTSAKPMMPAPSASTRRRAPSVRDARRFVRPVRGADPPLRSGTHADRHLAAVEIEVDFRGVGREGALVGQLLVGVVAAAEAQPVGDAGDERAGQPADDEPGQQGRDQRERAPRGDDRQADDDERDRPQPPGAAGGIAVDGARLDRQRDDAGGDEGNPPEDEAAVDLHGSVLSCSDRHNSRADGDPAVLAGGIIMSVVRRALTMLASTSLAISFAGPTSGSQPVELPAWACSPDDIAAAASSAVGTRRVGGGRRKRPPPRPGHGPGGPRPATVREGSRAQHVLGDGSGVLARGDRWCHRRRHGRADPEPDRRDQPCVQRQRRRSGGRLQLLADGRHAHRPRGLVPDAVGRSGARDEAGAQAGREQRPQHLLDERRGVPGLRIPPRDHGHRAGIPRRRRARLADDARHLDGVCRRLRRGRHAHARGRATG